MNIQILSKKLAVIAAVMILATGCKKDPVIKIEPPQPLPLVQELVIDFYPAGIQLNNIDQSKLEIRDANNDIKKMISLQHRDASLYRSVADLPAGTYKVNIAVRTKAEADQTAREYAIAKTIELPLQENFRLRAPLGNFAEDWFKRVVLSAANEEAIAVIAMDPRDAYYGVSFKQAAWKQVSLQRSAINNNVMAANMEAGRNLKDVIGFAELSAFTPFTNAMQGKSWTKGCISLYLLHNDGHSVTMDYMYNK